MDPSRPRASDQKISDPTIQNQTIAHLIDYLAIADPQAAQRMGHHLRNADPLAVIDPLASMVDEVIEALVVEITFGRQLADGMGRILAYGRRIELNRYRRLVREAASKGPTLATLIARHLVPVLVCGDSRLADRFEETTRVMLKKGTYTLKAPLETLSALIEARDLICAHAFIDLLAVTYALPISYNRTVYLTHTLPRAVNGLAPKRRLWQIQGLVRIIGEDECLIDDYLQGLAMGLHLLSATTLNQFIDQAIRRYHQDRDAGKRFIALQSRHAMDMCRDLQVAVPLSAVRSELERYLRARTGLAVAIRPFSTLPTEHAHPPTDVPLVRCNGQAIYLPDEMDLMQQRQDNAAFYKLLVRLEAGAIEFGTYDLDVEKTLDTAINTAPPTLAAATTTVSDLAHFLNRFGRRELALDLFTLFEHSRVARHVKQCYPGLFRRLCRAMDDNDLAVRTGNEASGTLLPLYRHLVMDEPPTADTIGNLDSQTLAARLDGLSSSDSDSVEASARLVMECYPRLASHVATHGKTPYRPLVLPFGRRLEPSFFNPFFGAYDRLAAIIQHRLAQLKVKAYRSDIRHLLIRQRGQLSSADIRSAIVEPSSATSSAVDLCGLDLGTLMAENGLGRPAKDADPTHAFRYPEWDGCMGDYLPNHARVLEHCIEAADPGFYRQTLEDFNGLIKRIRYAFELLRPEAMTILRRWREGDAFDYRALLDYVVDRKAGLMPSERLFIKRVKRIRDVAALLLVDLSRSTTNAVDASGARVVDIERQAIVLLCEALKVVGDRFAIAGFSGTGPLGVDYYRIKDLDEPVDDKVKGRISAMAPQRNTRMGAAIRHATSRLIGVASRVRLIIVLGDGFPNDVAYKAAYAVEDTRQAVMEARAAAIHVKAITVNVTDNGLLDRLYGPAHHTLIGHVADLPDKLVKVYSALTRH